MLPSLNKGFVVVVVVVVVVSQVVFPTALPSTIKYHSGQSTCKNDIKKVPEMNVNSL